MIVKAHHEIPRLQRLMDSYLLVLGKAVYLTRRIVVNFLSEYSNNAKLEYSGRFQTLEQPKSVQNLQSSVNCSIKSSITRNCLKLHGQLPINIQNNSSKISTINATSLVQHIISRPVCLVMGIILRLYRAIFKEKTVILDAFLCQILGVD